MRAGWISSRATSDATGATSVTSAAGMSRTRSIAPRGSTSFDRNGQRRIYASACARLISRNPGVKRDTHTAPVFADPTRKIASTFPALSASTAASPPSGRSRVGAAAAPLASSRSRPSLRVPLPSPPIAIRLPRSWTRLSSSTLAR